MKGFTDIDQHGVILLINEISPVARFPSPKKLVSYSGIVPSIHQSGNHTTHKPIAKESNNHLRWTLNEAT